MNRPPDAHPGASLILPPEGSRRAALRRLRRRIRAAGASGRRGGPERQLALQMRRLRERISAEIGAVHACAGCAAASRQPTDGWPLGDCCTGAAGIVFDEVELSALHAAGTRPRHLRWRRPPARGCPHCGPRGCRLPPRHRPNRCVWYLCPPLSRELHARGRLDSVEQACQRLGHLFERFAELRRRRLEERFCDELERRLRT